MNRQITTDALLASPRRAAITAGVMRWPEYMQGRRLRTTNASPPLSHRANSIVPAASAVLTERVAALPVALLSPLVASTSEPIIELTPETFDAYLAEGDSQLVVVDFYTVRAWPYDMHEGLIFGALLEWVLQPVHAMTTETAWDCRIHADPVSSCTSTTRRCPKSSRRSSLQSSTVG